LSEASPAAVRGQIAASGAPLTPEAGVTAAQRSGLARWPWVAIVLLTPIFIFGVFGPLLYPHDPAAADFSKTLLPPAWLEGGNWSYLLGTDTLGRDLFSRIMAGARVSLLVAVVGVIGAGLIGVPLGLLAGYAGGWVDNVIMRIADVKMSIPAVLLIILIGSALGGGLRTILISIVIVFWASYARVIRGEALVLRNRPFVALARVANCSHARILLRHMLPNVSSTAIVLVTLQFGPAIMIEAGISFLGLGIQPPASAWGLLINDGRTVLETAWWLALFPGLAVMITVLGANLLGDWLSQVVDPKRRNK
jgi:peptide/nickel transport system permease protein